MDHLNCNHSIKKKKKKKMLRKDVEVEAEITSTPLTVTAPSKANAEKGGFVWIPFMRTPSTLLTPSKTRQTLLTPSKTRQTRHPKAQWLAALPNFRPHQNLVSQQLQGSLLGPSAGALLVAGALWEITSFSLNQHQSLKMTKKPPNPPPKTKNKIKKYI